MAKRNNGEGSWGKKKISGILYYYYRDPDGKYTYSRTQKELKQKVKELQSGYKFDKEMTFGKYILHWLETVKKNSLESQTYDGYENLIQSMILGYKGYRIARIPMERLDSDKLQKYVNALAGDYSRASIQKIWAIIKQCIEYAEIKKEVKPYTTKLVNLPTEANVKVKKKEVPFLSIEQMNTFYYTALSKTVNGYPVFGNNAYALILIMYTGMRVSECIALKWKNVDLINKKIHVKESAAMVKDRSTGAEKKYVAVDKGTKTEKSERTIPLTNRAIEAIKYFESFQKSHRTSDYVCVNKHCGKMERRGINRSVGRIIEASGMEFKDRFTTHSLRHSYGSALLSQGVEIKVVSELLGHKDISTTYNIYIGILESDKSSAVTSVFDK